jgi:hypothetical protein
MKRVLTITARNGGTTAKVRIEVECRKDQERPWSYSTPMLARRVLHGIADGVMEAIADADYFKVPLSRQRVGR